MCFRNRSYGCLQPKFRDFLPFYGVFRALADVKTRSRSASALALVALAVTATQSRPQSIYTPYAFTNFAGNSGFSGTNNGTGSAAQFGGPSGVAVDNAGNVYVTDSNNHTIRKITPDGEVTTLAGSAGQTGS